MRPLSRQSGQFVGLWRSWERVSMALRRSGVQVPSGPPVKQGGTAEWPFVPEAKGQVYYLTPSHFPLKRSRDKGVSGQEGGSMGSDLRKPRIPLTEEVI